MKAKLIIAGTILLLIAGIAGITYLYMQARIERDYAKNEVQTVDQGYRAAIDYWQSTAEERSKQLEVLNEGYAKARSEKAIAEKYLADHKLAKAITHKSGLVTPIYNRMVAGLFNDISDATTRYTKATGTSKTSKTGRTKTNSP